MNLNHPNEEPSLLKIAQFNMFFETIDNEDYSENLILLLFHFLYTNYNNDKSGYIF